jgi:hypothetical protein
VPALSLKVQVHADGARRSADVEAHLDEAHLIVGQHKLDLSGLADSLHASLDGDPLTGELQVEHRIALARLGQDFVATYPIAQLEVTSRARRKGDGTLHLDAFELENRAAGTKLSLHGGLLLPRGASHRLLRVSTPLVGWSSLGLKGSLEQRLDGISGDAARFRGKGQLELGVDVASGDLRRFHVEANLRAHKVDLALPQSRVQVLGLDAEVPLVEDLVVEHKRLRILPSAESNAYPQLRFTDQQPFLSGAGALRADRVQVRDFAVTGLAGNLRILRTLFSLDQLEAELRGGRVAGQCLVDARGADSTVQLRLRATGILAEHGGKRERFDGNAALAFSVQRREIDGRAEILRIGRHHLLELLDEFDPYHNEPATNRVRSALRFGYPDRVRLLFDRGFASLSVELGGLARLVQIGEVHGIPTGPLVERYLGALLSTEKPE